MIGAGVVHKIDLDRGQGAVLLRPTLVADDRRMTFARGEDVFLAIEHELHRPSRLPRKQGGKRTNERRHVLFPAERAARRRLHHVHLGKRQAEDAGHRPLYVKRALHRAVYGHRAVLIRDRYRSLCLKVSVLLISGTVLSLYNHIRLSEADVGIAFADAHVVEQIVPTFRSLRHGNRGRIGGKRINRIGNKWKRFVVDLRQPFRTPCSGAIRCCNERNRFPDVAHNSSSESRLVVVNNMNHVLARNVIGRNCTQHRRIGLRFGEIDTRYPPVRNGATDDARVQHAGKGEVIYVPCLSTNLVYCVWPKGRGSDKPLPSCPAFFFHSYSRPPMVSVRIAFWVCKRFSA